MTSFHMLSTFLLMVLLGLVMREKVDIATIEGTAEVEEARGTGEGRVRDG